MTIQNALSDVYRVVVKYWHWLWSVSIACFTVIIDDRCQNRVTDGETVGKEYYNRSEEHQACTTTIICRPFTKIFRYDSKLFSYHFFVGSDSQEQLVNSWVLEIVIYLPVYLWTSFHPSGIHCLRTHSALVLHEQMGFIAATKLVWIVVVLNGSEACGPLTIGRELKIGGALWLKWVEQLWQSELLFLGRYILKKVVFRGVHFWSSHDHRFWTLWTPDPRLRFQSFPLLCTAREGYYYYK